MNDEKCICCGENLHTPDKPLCHYCLYRSEVGTAKYLMFKAMIQSGNEYYSIKEIMVMTNEIRAGLNIEPVGYHGVQKILRRYSKHYRDRSKKGKGYLLLVKNERVKTRNGGPIKKFKLSQRLEKRFKDYEKRWMSGLPVNKRVKNGKNFKMTMDYKMRANSIRMRIKTGKIGMYEHIMYLSNKNFNK